jgi:hypothetical protein
MAGRLPGSVPSIASEPSVARSWDDPGSSPEHQEQCGQIDRLPDADCDALHGTGARRAKFVLHLHGLDDEELLAGIDIVALGNRDGHNPPRDDRTDLERSGVRGILAASPGAFAEPRGPFGLDREKDSPSSNDDLAALNAEA